MPAKRNTILNPYLNEFVYDQMVKATTEQKIKLGGRLLKYMKNSRVAKAFATKSTIEDKAIMLAKLGVSFSWCLNLSKQKLNEIYEEHSESTASKLSNAMLKEKVFVVTDKQIMSFLGIMAANCHGETYMMNRDFFTMGYKVKEFRKEFSNPTNREIKEGVLIAKDLSRLFLGAMTASRFSDGIFGISSFSLELLMYLYSREKEYITEEEIRSYFGSLYRNFKLTTAIKNLSEAMYIEKGEGDFVRSYKVTAWGADTVLKFERKVFNLEKF